MESTKNREQMPKKICIGVGPWFTERHLHSLVYKKHLPEGLRNQNYAVVPI